MALTLITGPANAGKAGEVLGAFRALLPRTPLLVVPTGADVAHYRRQLTARGALLGGDVVTFAGLAREIARRTRTDAPVVGALTREHLLARAVACAGLRALAASASSAGFQHAAGALIAELQGALVSPGRLRRALRAWTAGDDDRAAYG